MRTIIEGSQHYFDAFTHPITVGLISLAMAVPLYFDTAIKSEFVLTLFLAPVIAYAIWGSRNDFLTKMFVLAGICGLVSIGVVNLMAPHNLRENISGLIIWTMLPTSFLFLGRRLPLERTVFWLAVISAAFLIIVTVPLLVTGNPTRAVNPTPVLGFAAGTSYLDIRFLGLLVYASFGVNSLAPFFCIQASVICGALYSTSTPYRFLLSAGLACATLLIIESNSRTAQATLALLLLAAAIYAMRQHKHLVPTVLVIVGIMVGSLAADLRTSDNWRLASLMTDSKWTSIHNEQKSSEYVSALQSITTGRYLLWQAAIQDIFHSPVFGNGFAGFGRFSDGGSKELNTTAHCYFLTLLWKGGIVFFVPFLIFVSSAFRRAWMRYTASSEWYFASTAVVLMFLLPSLTWDILMIPSAGALAWLLLGLVQSPHTRALEIESTRSHLSQLNL